MKEVAITATAVVGLFGFAALYNSGGSSHRAKREIFEVEIDDLEDPFTADTYGFNGSMDNISNSTWDKFLSEVGIEADLEEDVQTKAALARLRDFQLRNDGFVNNLKREHRNRGNKNGDAVASANTQTARDSPNVLDQQREAGQNDGDEVNYFAGAANTHPKIERLLEDFGWNDNMNGFLRNAGSATVSTQFWFLFPAAVPLGSDTGKHTQDWANFFEFAKRFGKHIPTHNRKFRISIGLWARGAVFSPRGTIYTGRFPWARIARVYKKPRLTGAQPMIVPTFRTLNQFTSNYGTSSATAGSNCFIFWFHQDWAMDGTSLLTSQGFESVQQLNSQCTVMHSFVGMERNEANMAYAAWMLPGLQSSVPIDEEFSQVWFFPDHASVNTDETVRAFAKFVTLVDARSGCRTTRSGWSAPPTQSDITMLPNTQAPAFDDASDNGSDSFASMDDGPDYQFSGTAAPTYDTYASDTTEGATMRGLEEDSTPKVPEIDSCCGHSIFNGIPYDSELRTCCEDGTVKPLGEFDACIDFNF